MRNKNSNSMNLYINANMEIYIKNLKKNKNFSKDNRLHNETTDRRILYDEMSKPNKYI